jgi:hypothetical protein
LDRVYGFMDALELLVDVGEKGTHHVEDVLLVR